jgi:hypothetical protein
MTIASEITRIKDNIAAAYTAAGNKGATMPVTQNSANLATTVASVPESSAETVTATNGSSYDRVTGEKVWLNKSGNNYSIINYASADINSFIGTCKANIAIGSSGSVETLNNGVLVPHLVRDFTLGAGMEESFIDDTAGTATIPLSLANNNWRLNGTLISPQLNVTSANEKNFKLKARFKIINNDPNTTPNLTSLAFRLASTNFENTTTWSDVKQPPFLIIESGYFRGIYPINSSGVSGIKYINYSTTGLIALDSWFEMSVETDTSPYATLTIKDALGNTYTQTDTSAACWFNDGTIQRAFVGFFTGMDNSTLSVVFDLTQCGLFSRDENTTYWTPYKEVEG